MNMLVRIAALDDNLMWINKIKSWLNNLNGFEIINLEFSFFTCNFLLIDYLLESNIDLLLLDYDMPDINGLDLARKLQTISPETKIIFITGYEDLLPVSIDANFLDNCIGLIKKTTTEENFLFEVENAVKKIANVHFIEINHFSRTYNIDTNRTEKVWDISLIDANKIEFIQSSDKDTTVYLVNQAFYTTNTPLNEWLAMLSPFGLIRISKSDIINLRYIKSAKGNEIQLSSGEDFSLSRRYKKEFDIKRREFLVKEARK